MEHRFKDEIKANFEGVKLKLLKSPAICKTLGLTACNEPFFKVKIS